MARSRRRSPRSRSPSITSSPSTGRGATTYGNLALSCPHDNFHKGPNIAGLDPVTGRLTRLFNPRRQRWSTHFAWDGPLVVGKTAIGRTTVYVLNLNHPDRVELRRLLIAAGIFPP